MSQDERKELEHAWEIETEFRPGTNFFFVGVIVDSYIQVKFKLYFDMFREPEAVSKPSA